MDNILIVGNNDPSNNLLNDFLINGLRSDIAPALNELWVLQIDPLKEAGLNIIMEYSTIDDGPSKDVGAIRHSYEIINNLAKKNNCMFVSAVNIPGTSLSIDRDSSMSPLGVLGGVISKGRSYPSSFSIIINEGVFSLVDGFFRPWMYAVSAKSLKNQDLKTDIRCIFFERAGSKGFQERKRYTFKRCSPIDIKGYETTYSASSNPKQLSIDISFDKMISDVTRIDYDETSAKVHSKLNEQRVIGRDVGVNNTEISDEERVTFDQINSNNLDSKTKTVEINKTDTPDEKALPSYKQVPLTKLFPDIRYTGKILSIHGTNLSNIIDPFDIIRVSKYVKFLNAVNFLKAPGVTYLLKMLIDEGFSKIVNNFRLKDTVSYGKPSTSPNTTTGIVQKVIRINSNDDNPSSDTTPIQINSDDDNPSGRSKAISIGQDDDNPVGKSKTISISENDSSPMSKFKTLTVPEDENIRNSFKVVEINQNDSLVRLQTEPDTSPLDFDERYYRTAKINKDDSKDFKEFPKMVTIKRFDSPSY